MVSALRHSDAGLPVALFEGEYFKGLIIITAESFLQIGTLSVLIYEFLDLKRGNYNTCQDKNVYYAKYIKIYDDLME